MSAPATTSVSPGAAHLWRRTRGLLIAAAVLAVAGIVIAALRSGQHSGSLDPRSAAPQGTKALARLLDQHGVTTRVLTDPAELRAHADHRTTLLVPAAEPLGKQDLKALRAAADQAGRTVVLGSGPEATAALAPGVRTTPSPLPVRQLTPACDFLAAQRAGSVSLGGFRYSTSRPHTDACYRDDGRATMLRVSGTTDGRASAQAETVLLGAPDPLYNKNLDKEGNASLSLQLLGRHPEVLWFLPSSAGSGSPEGEERSFLDLVPPGWTWGTLQLAVAAVLAAVWRARRLGPLVHEQLPSVVPAAETTEGRARLYRRADARGHAAEALRSATRTRLAPLLGVPPGQAHDEQLLLPALATRSPSRPGTEAPSTAGVRALLFGPAPRSDSELIDLADELDRLENALLTDAPASPPTEKDRPS